MLYPKEKDLKTVAINLEELVIDAMLSSPVNCKRNQIPPCSQPYTAFHFLTLGAGKEQQIELTRINLKLKLTLLTRMKGIVAKLFLF